MNTSPTTTQSDTARKRTWIIPLILVLAGIAILLYPVIATQYNNIQQHRFAREYLADVGKASPQDLNKQLARAVEYNKNLTGVPVLDPYLEEVQSPESQAYENYISQLNDFNVMARVRVPSVNIDLPIRHGTEEAAISEGAGHLYGTSLPVGGESTHAVITSHTGIATATLFDNLTKVEKGEVFFIDVYGKTLAYKVDQIKVVLPDEIGDLKTISGKDYLTLFTCTPYAVNSHRLLVRGERIPYNDAIDSSSNTSESFKFHLEPWMWGLIFAAIIGTCGALTIIARERKKRNIPCPHPQFPEK
ncbi:MAG: class C sortase [Arcanobacterium sp.]|nr:class C sortase [Arcanobacterium sp.]